MGKVKNNEKSFDKNKWMILGLILIALTFVIAVGITSLSKRNIELEGSIQNISAGTTAKVKRVKLSDATLQKIFATSGFYIPTTGKTDDITMYWKYLTSDNLWVYCIELGIRTGIAEGVYSDRPTSSTSSYWNSLSAAKRDLIELITIYGYPNVKRDNLVTGGNAAEYQYMATQILIWEVQQGWRTSSGRNNTTLYNKYIKDNSSLKAVYEAIEKDLANNNIKPSFASEIGSLISKKLEYNESTKKYSLTLTDTNNSLSLFNITCENGLSCTVSGNKLTITSSTSVSKSNVKFVRKTPNGISQAFLILDNGKDQRMILGKATLLPNNYYVSVSATENVKGTLTIKKTSDDGVKQGFKFRVTSILNAYSKTFTTDANGEIRVTDLKSGMYEITEIDVPDRYVKSLINMQVAVFGEGKSEATVTFHNVLKDTKGLKIIKVDAETNSPIAGAQLCITGVNKKGCTLPEESWTSTDTYYTSTKASQLTAGHEYYICEKKAPDGYELGECLPFKLKKDEQTIIEYKNTKKVIVPETHEVVISKLERGKGTNALIGGAKLKLLDKDGNVIQTWVTENGKTKTITGLNPGTYTLVEDSAPKGYTKAQNVTFKIDESKKTINVEMYDDPTTVQISKVSTTSGEEIAGAHLQVIDADNKIVEEWDSVAGQTHIIVGKLIYGETYTLKETQAPSGYVIAESISFTVGSNDKVVMKNKPTEVRVYKKDTVSGKFVAGAHLQLIDQSGKIVREWDTTDREEVITGLPIGVEFTLKETITPENYLEAADMTFALSSGEAVREITMLDTPIIDVPNTAADASIITIIAGSVLVVFGIGTVIWLKKKEV